MTSSAVRTAARVASEMPGLPLSTRLTVASETPACFATSASLPAMLQDYCKILQKLPGRLQCEVVGDAERSVVPARERRDERLLDAEDGVRVEIRIAGCEHVRRQRPEAVGADPEVDVRRTHRASRRRLQ